MGESSRKTKRGFDTKRDVLVWEREFLQRYSGSLYMTFDFERKIKHVTKSYQRIKGEDVITPPKTEKGIRCVLMLIANRVGHKSIDITYRYAHVFPSTQMEVVSKLNNIMTISAGCVEK